MEIIYYCFDQTLPPTALTTTTIMLAFNHGQILDTLKTMAQAHVGTFEGDYGFSYDFRGPNLGAGNGLGNDSFVKGQPNISCNAFQTVDVNLTN